MGLRIPANREQPVQHEQKILLRTGTGGGLRSLVERGGSRRGTNLLSMAELCPHFKMKSSSDDLGAWSPHKGQNLGYLMGEHLSNVVSSSGLGAECPLLGSAGSQLRSSSISRVKSGLHRGLCVYISVVLQRRFADFHPLRGFAEG